MPASNEEEIVNLSPWMHPKAKRWFQELLEETHLPLMMEHAVDKPDDTLGEGETRLMVALALLLGRDGIWPAQRDLVLRTIVRKGNVVATRSSERKEGPISLSQHRDQASRHQQMIHEVEMLRRRIGMSNRRAAMDPPAWGKFWS